MPLPWESRRSTSRRRNTPSNSEQKTDQELATEKQNLEEKFAGLEGVKPQLEAQLIEVCNEFFIAARESGNNGLADQLQTRISSFVANINYSDLECNKFGNPYVTIRSGADNEHLVIETINTIVSATSMPSTLSKKYSGVEALHNFRSSVVTMLGIQPSDINFRQF